MGHQLPNFTYTLMGSELVVTDQVMDLGVVVHRTDENVDPVCR